MNYLTGDIPRRSASGFAGADHHEQGQRYRKKPPLSALGRVVADILGDVWGGIYHLDSNDLNRKGTDWTSDYCIRVELPVTLSTYDFSELTFLVVLCHDRAIRLEVSAASRGRLALIFHPRQRTGDMNRRHPTMEEAVERVRKAYPHRHEPGTEPVKGLDTWADDGGRVAA